MPTYHARYACEWVVASEEGKCLGMPGTRDLVVVGGSAGGVEALVRFVSDLPTDLPATVLVGLHLSREVRSMLPGLLARRSKISVVPAADGLVLVPGQVVVGVPDRHLLVVEDQVVLGRGARENGHRPSHDAMLRSAALLRGPRTVGVVLTGLLDDGSAGLTCVERYGGCCVVQDPADAAFPDMPRNALRAVPDAAQVPLSALTDEVVRMVNGEPAASPEVDPEQHQNDLSELASALGVNNRLPDGSVVGVPSPFACPSCHGVLNHVPDDILRYRCRTGHAWSAEALIAQQDRSVEEALWAALRALEERADLADRLATRSTSGGRDWSAHHYESRRDDARKSAEVLRHVLTQTTERSVPDEPSA
ncbi:MAG: chemotaxis protein CheB [Frankiales bacterium]|nr:chemotaxis protein CheB [Frankiales bacterium]